LHLFGYDSYVVGFALFAIGYLYIQILF